MECQNGVSRRPEANIPDLAGILSNWDVLWSAMESVHYIVNAFKRLGNGQPTVEPFDLFKDLNAHWLFLKEINLVENNFFCTIYLHILNSQKSSCKHKFWPKGNISVNTPFIACIFCAVCLLKKDDSKPNQ